LLNEQSNIHEHFNNRIKKSNFIGCWIIFNFGGDLGEDKRWRKKLQNKEEIQTDLKKPSMSKF